MRHAAKFLMKTRVGTNMNVHRFNAKEIFIKHTVEIEDDSYIRCSTLYIWFYDATAC